jgi:hypothetical protein
MVFPAVLQAAKVGQILIELKASAAHGDFREKCSRVGILDKNTITRLMTLARN